MLRTMFFALLTALFAGELAAQESAEQAGEEAAVEVSTSVRAPIRAFDSERSQNVVSASDIRESQASSLTASLSGEPGIQVQSTNRGAGTLVLRGLVGPENLIVIDGVRFNQSTFRTGPNQYVDTIDPWGVRQLEVVRGPGGVLYGTGAMGGVLHVLPLDLPERTEARARFGFHSADDTAGASVDAGTRKGPFAARAGVTRRRHGRLRAGATGARAAPFVSGIDGNEFLAQPYEDLHLRAATGVHVGDHRLRANYQGAIVRDAMRLDRLGRGEVRTYDNDDHLTYLTAEFDGVGAVDELRANLSWHRTNEVVRRFNCSAAGDRVRNVQSCAALNREVLEKVRRNQDEVDTLGASFTGVSRLLDDSLTVTWGGDGYHDVVASERSDGSTPHLVLVDRGRGNFADGSSYYTAGAFALARYELRRDNDALRVHGGTRVEAFGARAPKVSSEIGDVAYDFVGVVGSAGIAWVSGTALNAYLNWNQGFRAPNLQETTVLGDTGNFYELPNPGLGPERSDTFELGAKVDWSGVVRLQPAIWLSLLSNRITREPHMLGGESEVDGKEIRRRVNRDSAYFYGADLSFETARWQGVSLFGGASWVDGAIEAEQQSDAFSEGPLHGLLGGGRDYENPRRLPPATTTVGLRYQPARAWFLSLHLASAVAQKKLGPDDLSDLRICEVDKGVLADECGGTAGWATLNARAGYRYETMTIDLAALNLTDQRYRLHGSGVPAPGLDLAAQITLEY